MEKEKKENIFQQFIDESPWSLRQFALGARIPYSTIYPIYWGKRLPKRKLALKICKGTKGKIRMKDFGYE